MRGVLPSAMREALEARLSARPTVVVPDPYLAQILRTETGYEGFTDIYTWAIERCKGRKPNPIDLLHAYEAGLAAIGVRPTQSDHNVAEIWDAAQRLGRDWEEVLRGAFSLNQAYTFWQNLAAHRLVQQTFQLYAQDEPPAWLKVLPFPYRSPRHTRTFWEKFGDFLTAYQQHLRQQGIMFSEEALHRLRDTKRSYKGVIFLHIYGLYPAIVGFLQHAVAESAEIWGWDTAPLKAALTEIWQGYEGGFTVFPFPHRQRQVFLHLRTTLVEVIEAAAQKITEYVHAHPDARIAVWCEGESVALLRYFLEQHGLGGLLSPAPLTLAEGTHIGRQLTAYTSAGIAGQLHEWPPVAGDHPDPAERWAEQLYETVKKRSDPDSGEAWRFLLRLLQSEAPQDSLSFSADTRIYIGRVTQLAGGHYDAVFLIEPPAEPLGRWMRPSFWLASLRRQFSPPEWHQQTAWRLVSILLWGSEEVHLFRRSGHEYSTPLEEFLRHYDLFDVQGTFAAPEESAFAVIKPTAPQPLSHDSSVAYRTLSPSVLGQLIVCPRRAYWGQLLKDRPANPAAELGQILHDIVAQSFPSKKISLRRLGYKFSARRMFYRLTSKKAGRGSGWRRAYHFLRPLIAEVGQPILKTLLDLLASNPSFPSKGRLKWRHLYAYRHITCRFISEDWIAHPQLPMGGRVDLIVEADSVDPATGEALTRRLLLDFKSSVYKDPSRFSDIVSAAKAGIEKLVHGESYRTPEGFREVVFQLLLYGWMLAARGTPIDQAALVSLWWRPGETDNRRRPYEVYSSVDIDLLSDEIAKLFIHLPEYLSTATSQEDFPMTEERTHCAYCDFALLCDRLS